PKCLAPRTGHRAAKDPCRGSLCTGMSAPRTPHRNGVPARRAAGRASVAVQCFMR
ncbi:hypothetical protein HAX54_038801, partial [Datura stramonium]|nr:hypothetical protein [Datura stramonium]